jgi:HEAT repeat protein
VNELENIIQELDVPLKTFRIFAIEKAIRAGKSPELLAALKKCLTTETDPECKLLLEHAVASIEERLVAGSTPSQSGHDNEKILQNFSSLKPAQQLEFIKNAGRKCLCAKGSENRIARILEAAAHPVVAAELIRKCLQSWPSAQINYLEQNLFSPSSVLQLACVEAIIFHSPEILQQNFEKLVLAPDPLLRALAIRGLARNFPESAAQFLAECLRKSEYYGRLAALRVCSVMRFDLIKNSLLELLHTEKDPRLLKIAAAIVVSNPDKEIPYRLCEIIARGGSENSKFLQDLIRKCCEMIKLAELSEDFSEYLDSVQKYNRNVQAKYLVLNFADAISQASEVRKEELRKLFDEKVRNAEVQQALSELQKTQPAIVKTLFRKPEAAPSSISEQKTVETELAKEEAQKLTGEETLLRQLIICQTGEIAQPHEKIARAFAGTEPELISAAFRAAVTIKDNRWLSRVKAYLKSENEEVVAAAFEYLATFDAENFLLLLRGYVNSPSLLVRTTLLRNVCRISSEVARELLTSMLNDAQPTTREKALGSIIHFEFASIREVLTDYLSRENSEELIESCLSFYLANPVLESVYDLKMLEKRKEFTQNFSRAREMLIGIIDELKIANPEEIHRFIQEREQKLEAAQKGDKAESHEKKKLESIKSRVKWSKPAAVEPERISFIPYLKLLVPVGVIVVAIFWFLSSDTDTVETRRAMKTVPLAGTVQDYTLIVQNIDKLDGALIGMTADKKFVRAIPRPGKLFLLDPGDRIKLKGLPFKIAPDGTMIVKTISIKKEI